MKIKGYEFPTFEDSYDAIEKKYCELVNRYREDELDIEEQDWMDTANTWLITADR
jgi:hypothetical protein